MARILLLLVSAFFHRTLAFVHSSVVVERRGVVSHFFWNSNSIEDDESKKAQMEAQKKILERRRNKDARNQYFSNVEKKRNEANQERDLWKFQTDTNQDPLIEWKRLRKEGKIKDLKREDQQGGIPIPLPSFGVGGQFGVGGEYDNGERFDLRLPYAEQGYVDEESDVMGKLGRFFGGKKGGDKG